MISFPLKTPITYAFDESAGYDCISGGYDIRDAAGDKILTIDMLDFCHGKATYRERALPNKDAEQIARDIVDILNLKYGTVS